MDDWYEDWFYDMFERTLAELEADGTLEEVRLLALDLITLDDYPILH